MTAGAWDLMEKVNLSNKVNVIGLDHFVVFVCPCLEGTYTVVDFEGMFGAG